MFLAIDEYSSCTVLMSQRSQRWSSRVMTRIAGCSGVLSENFFLGEQHDGVGRIGSRKQEIPIRGAARHLQVNEALVDLVEAQRLAMHREQARVVHRERHVEFAQERCRRARWPAKSISLPSSTAVTS